MNKYSLKSYFAQELKNVESTFKETSYDKDNNEYLCNDVVTKNVYNFDLYVEGLYPKPRERPSSIDAIYIGNQKLYFVEFKNQLSKDITKENIQSKFNKGTELLEKLLKDFSKSKDCKYHFCLVMKKRPKPRYLDYQHIENNVPKFGLAELNQALGGFYDSIVTQDIDFYKKEFIDLSCD